MHWGGMWRSSRETECSAIQCIGEGCGGALVKHSAVPCNAMHVEEGNRRALHGTTLYFTRASPHRPQRFAWHCTLLHESLTTSLLNALHGTTLCFRRAPPHPSPTRCMGRGETAGHCMALHCFTEHGEPCQNHPPPHCNVNKSPVPLTLTF